MAYVSVVTYTTVYDTAVSIGDKRKQYNKYCCLLLITIYTCNVSKNIVSEKTILVLSFCIHYCVLDKRQSLMSLIQARYRNKCIY